MHRIFLSCLWAIAMGLAFGQGEPRIDWIYTYGGAGDQIPQALSRTPDGALVMAGSVIHPTPSGSATVKVGMDGRVWFERVDRPNDRNYLKASNQCVDAEGYIYVVAETGGIGQPTYSTTLKIAPDGSLVWAHQMHPVNVEHLTPRSVAVGSDGRVFVCGAEIRDRDGANSFALYCLDSSGRLLWQDFLNEFAPSTDARSVFVNRDGTAIVVRGSISNGVSSNLEPLGRDSYIRKYSSTGSHVWTRRFSAIRQDGERYLSLYRGEWLGTGTLLLVGANTVRGGDGWMESLAYVLGLDHQGDIAMSHLLEHETNVSHYRDIAVSDGSVFCGGATGRRSSYHQGLMVKFDSELRPIWQALSNPNATRSAGFTNVAVDPFGSSYAAGIVDQNWGDIFCSRFSSAGSVQWTFVYDGPGSNSDGTKGLVVDEEGGVYIGGHAANRTNADFVLIKLRQCMADANGDGRTDSLDLEIVLERFGLEGPTGDLNGDGIVDDADLALALYFYGAEC
ncbi:MAG: hypothetical protein HUU60_01490 [Armatimonadetes bacterium]|nr:hypothetical protein [Armatimonadota bacterium]